MIHCINPKKNYLRHQQEIDQAIAKVCSSGKYVLDREVKRFEEEFCDFIGSRYAVGVASGTEAIFLSLKALGVGFGDEVITVSHTATATVSAIEASGAKAVFVDVEKDHLLIDVNMVEEGITKKTKAIIAVHLYGHPCDMDKLMEISNRHNISLIEDCAQASGAVYSGRSVGSIGDLGCFSFFPTKNLGCLGDGGAITTNSKTMHETLLSLRQYGWDADRESKIQGYNSRLDEIQAAILRVKLKYLDRYVNERNGVAQLYDKLLKGTSYVLPKVRGDCLHAYHLYVIQVQNRDKLLKFLRESDILAMVHYKQAVHMQATYKRNEKLVITENATSKILSLPLYPEIEETAVRYICEKLKQFDRENES